MLRDIKKFIGPKSDEELQIQRYRQLLNERSEPSPELHLKIGRLYEKIGEKANASIEYKQSAQSYMAREEYVGALVANKLIIRLDREDADANANVAFIELQQGITLSPAEFNMFLQDVGHPLRSSKGDRGPGDTRRSRSRLALNRDNARRQNEKHDPNFQANRQQLLDLIANDPDAEERFDSSFNIERQTLVETINEELSDGHLQDESPLVTDQNSQRTNDDDELEGDDLDDMPHLDLTHDESPGSRLTQPEDLEPSAPSIGDNVTDEPPQSDRTQDASPSPQPDLPESDLPESDSTHQSLCQRLGSCPVFSMLSEDELEELRRTVYLSDIPENKPVSHAFDDQHGLFVILDGQIELTQKILGSDQPSATFLLQSGEFWGEHEFLKQEEIEYFAVTKTGATIAEIPKSFLASIIKKHPSLLDRLKATCKRRWFSPFLGRVSLFQDFSPEEIQHIAESLLVKKMTQGSILIREGESDESIFLIASGKVEVSISLMEREELQVVQLETSYIPLACLEEGEVFGEGAFFAKEPRSATIIAKTDGRLLKLPGSHLKKLLLQYPQLESALQQCHQQRVQATMGTISRELKR